jgi:hypothetical protein
VVRCAREREGGDLVLARELFGEAAKKNVR